MGESIWRLKSEYLETQDAYYEAESRGDEVTMAKRRAQLIELAILINEKED